MLFHYNAGVEYLDSERMECEVLCQKVVQTVLLLMVE